MAFLFRTRSLVALVASLALVSGAVITTAALYLLQSRETARVQQMISMQLALSHFLSVLQDAETGQRGYLLTGRDDYLQPFAQATNALADAIETLTQ
jgi:CHASE3 domain sensor protein